MTAIDRLLSKVERIPFSGCWLYTGAVNQAGYGWVRDPDKKGPDRAHRIVYRELCGGIPDGLYVLHRCDVPCCVNPDHLFLGTPRDNMHDKIKKGRGTKPPIHLGEKHHNATISDADVELIKADHKPSSAIALQYGVSYNTIWRIKSGRSRCK